MVKRRKKGITKKATGKRFTEAPQEARKIGTVFIILENPPLFDSSDEDLMQAPMRA